MMKNMMLDTQVTPNGLKDRMLLLSALDIILSPEDWLRTYRMQSEWSSDVCLGEVNNGAGDTIHMLWTRGGVLLKGFDHESPVSPHARDEYEVWPGMYDGVPDDMMELLEDEALEKEDVTFCMWREAGDKEWRIGNTNFPEGYDDGSSFLLGKIIVTPEEYRDWAESYYELPISLGVVSQIFNGVPITAQMISALHPQRNVTEAIKELKQLGVQVHES
ncbi:hypothetical protein T3H97_09325 [Paenibacillus sp. LX16]|uniref:hypothetical protein n=1 Tax=Paenibacillus sp. LX16 TaxID=1740264 RepID=UPI002E27B155|nr:hypothetical protein [Paenibacillus sp. LX16]